jgi:sensor domain CHASE-containing protein
LRVTNDSAITISSGAIVLLGLVVMLAWHFGFARIVQLHTTFAPMQYNTALCFVLSGLAALYARSRPRFAGALAIVVAAIGLATLLQYALGVNFGIDELLMRGHITVRTSHAGRMSPQTASGFLLAGAAIAAMTLWRPSAHRELVVQVLASLVGGLGLAAVISYSVGLEPADNWSQFTRVALHTACGFLGLGLVVLLNTRRARARRRRLLLAVPVACASVAVTLSLFLALLEWQYARIGEATAFNVERAAAALEARLSGYVRSVDALADAWGRAGGEPQPTWGADVARFLRDEQVFLAISRGGPEGKFDWIFPSDPYPNHIGFDYSMSAQRSEAVALARERGAAFLTGPLALKSGRPAVLIIAPLLPAPGDRAPFVVAAALLEDLFGPTALDMPAHRLAVFEGEQLIHGAEPENGARAISAREVRFDGA